MLGSTATLAAQDAPTFRLREVRVTTAEIFDADDPRPLTKLATALHWQTREATVARELWFGAGDRIDAATAAELERNLRALGLFADVAVRLVPTGTPGEADLEVTTRDRLTLNFGAGASYVGGVTGFRASIGENNLFGTGDRIALSFTENSDGEYRGGFAFTDLHVLDSWHTATLRAAKTDEGDSYGLDVRRPFKHLSDPRAHSFALSHDEAEADYYRGGDSVAEVPYSRSAIGGDVTWTAGPPADRWTWGAELRGDTITYERARGPLGPQIRVPGDTHSVFFGPTASWRSIRAFRKVEGLDTLVYVQDITLGTSLGTSFGARWRDEDGRGGAMQPEFGVNAGWTGEPLAQAFVRIGVNGGVRLDDGDAVGWLAGASLRAFWLANDAHTFGVGSTFDAVAETQNLPAELTLGEDNGLRGYRARLLSGTRRLRTNVEHRFDTGIEFATLHFGTVAFFDVGHVGDGDESGRPFSSAGAGLRIGSKPLFGEGVLRIDVSKPFDDVVEQSDGWKVSLSVGQVFTFGG
ncbi:MAG: BamA/TamA family outer membrane protein [Planctomycetes bacterium]|nr:BamA/TamA family outer membrane protein [Planctomycetota bacterium]